MAKRNLEIRVENLENTVGSLSGLPMQMASLASQFVQLRQDVRAEISAIRSEVGELRGEVGELRGEVGELRGEVVTLGQTLREEMASMHRELAGAILATNVQMRALHEDLVERIRLIGEDRLPARGAHPESPTPPEAE